MSRILAQALENLSNGNKFNLKGDTFADVTWIGNNIPPTEVNINAEVDRLKILDSNAKVKQETDKASGNQKLKDLGLTDDEIAAITGQ